MPKYIFNKETLTYEVYASSGKLKFLKGLAAFAASIAVAFFYLWVYTSVLGYDLPKTAFLKKTNARLNSRLELLNRNLDSDSESLKSFQSRDNDIYRSVFGMNEIPAEVRNAGIGGVDRYSWLDEAGPGSLLKSTKIRLDVLSRKTFVQSKSFDDVTVLSKRAGDMAQCIPAVPPIDPVPGTYRISSSFGRRTDPISGRTAYHEGVDFACHVGNPVYATADGVVVKVQLERYGYGKNLIIDHGFGYKTRYAHMDEIDVKVGDVVKRGKFIGTSGNSGKSTGPHLHYEVLYRGAHVNPYNYYDLSMTHDEYMSLIAHTNE